MGIQKRRRLFPVFACLVGSLIFLAPGSKVGAETLTTAEYTAAPQPIGASPTPAQSLQGDPGDGFKPSLFSGSLVTTIPIEVPPGTNGVGPAISMEYDSGSNENGWLGLGWKIRGLSYIARSSEDGVPRYDSSDKFVLVLGGDTYKLVYGSDGYYHTQVETNLRIKNYGSYWEVIDNTGTKHRFGYNSDSQIPAIGKSATRLWAIDQTLDPDGNSIEYTYIVDSTDGGYYPYAILYTRGNGLSTYRKVQFEWEPRTDAIYDYTSGSVVKPGYRLHRIATYTGVTAIRNYIFSYVQSPFSARSLLQTVTMYNADQTASIRLAAMGYQQGENAFGTSTVWSPVGIGNFGDPFYLGDFNGDGRTDIASVLAGVGMRVGLSTGMSFADAGVWTTSGGGDKGRPYYLEDFNGDGKADLGEIRTGIGFVVRLSDGTKFDAPGSGTWFSGTVGGDLGEPIYIGDFNGDGMDDLAECKAGIGVVVHLSTGSNFYGQYSGTWSPMGSGNIGESFYFADFNGDGKTDIGNDVAGQGFRVALSTGTSFGAATIWDPTGGGDLGAPFYIGDFNGDGKTDISECRAGIGFVVRISTGADFQGNGSGTWSPIGIGDIGAPFYLADFNGDGKTDIANDVNGQGFRVALSTGTSFGSATIWDPTGGGDQGAPFYIGDFNGDGKADIGECRGGIGFIVRASTPMVKSDLLASLTNKEGGITSFGYQPSTQFSNTRLPFPMHILTAVTQNDGLNHVYKTSLTYSGGLYDLRKREFRGFNQVKTVEPDGDSTVTLFHQDEIFVGRPYREDRYNASGALAASEANMWSYQASPYSSDVKMVTLKQKDNWIYDPGGSYQTRMAYTYDQYGNITEEANQGNVAVSGDEMYTNTEYAYGVANWLPGVLKHRVVSNDVRKRVKESWYYYDGLGYGSVDKGHLTKEVNWLDTSDPNPLTPPDELLNQVITKEYDIFGNMVAVTDPRGNRTTTEFDATYYTFPVKTTNALGQIGTGEYDPGTGQPLAKVDANGNQTSYTYDVFGRLVQETGPDDLNSTYGTYTLYYQNYGNPASQHILTYRTENSGTADYLWSKGYFDGYGRVYKTETESAGGKSVIVDTVYDHRGRERQKSNQYFSGETPRWTVFDYDALSRPVKASYPDGTSTSTSYAGLVVTATDRNGNQKVFTNDAYGRTVGQKDPYGKEFRYTYDVVGNLIKWTDPNGNAFAFNYDSLGRQILSDNPVTGKWTYQYDLAGNLTSRTDANGNTTLYGYDALNRPMKKDYPTGVDVTYVYDEAAYPNAIGRLTRVLDGSGQKEYFYDRKGWQVKVVQTVDGVGYTTEATYNALDKVTRLTYPDGFVVDYRYDVGSNLSQIAAETSAYATIPGYNAHRQPLTVNYGNGIGAQYTYDPNNWRMTALNTKNGSLQNLSYQYDNTGNVTGITDNAPVSTFHPVAETQSFTYDKLDQVATANGPYGNLTYTYDAAGNFLTKEGITYTYDLTRPYTVVGRSDGFQASYDANGNMVTRNDFAYQYDYENRLAGVSKAGVEVARYIYDADGQRVKAVTHSGTTLYIGELYEVAGATVRKHIRANGKLVATIESSDALTNTYYYHPNHIGSTNVVTDAAGNEVQRIEYLPFGKTRVEVGLSRTQYKFTGKELDEETSLYYYGARYYDPELGRFITSDPIQSGVNWYVYTANNPLRYVDPWGLRLAVTGSMNEEEKDPDGQHVWSGDIRYDSQHAFANEVHEREKGGNAKETNDILVGAVGVAVGGELAVGAAAKALPALGTLASAVASKISSAVSWLRDRLSPTASAAEQQVAANSGKPLYRYMSEAELKAVQETGYLRGGQSGPTYWTDSLYRNAVRAQERLSLKTPPAYRVEFQIRNNPLIEGGTKVQPANGMSGGGREYWSMDPVQVDIFNFQLIGPR